MDKHHVAPVGSVEHGERHLLPLPDESDRAVAQRQEKTSARGATEINGDRENAVVPLRVYARRAHDAGLCVVPPKQDGTKSPLGTWRQYMKNQPDRSQIEGWYRADTRTGIGYVCGAVSGGLEVFEFDDEAAWVAFAALIADHGLETLWERIIDGYLERSPSGGVHVFWRTNAEEGSQKLAKRPKRPEEMKDERDKIKTLIETRAEGGYIVAAPSHGSVHPSGARYDLLRGGVGTIVTVSADERETLFALARMLDEIEPKQFGPASRQGGDRPGDRFNAATKWEELLPRYGWTLVCQQGETAHWRRPGKTDGVSATTNYRDNDRLHVFTTSTPLDNNRSYDRFGFFVVMEHDGDFAAAAAAISSGVSVDTCGATKSTQRNPADGGKSRSGHSRLIVRSLADVEPRAVEWLWRGWLARGKLHLLGGMPGDGKSTLAAAIAALGSTGEIWPDGTAAPQFRTLFILGEDSLEDTLRPRLDLHGADVTRIEAVDAVLDDDDRERAFHVAKHITELEKVVVDHGIDLIVADPLTTIMGGQDRNDEGSVRDALTPVVKLAERRNVGILGIVHVGKSTGVDRVAAQRILGSTAFVALARVVWQTARVDADTMALGVTKANLSMKPETLLWSRPDDSPVKWHGVTDRTIDDLMAAKEARAPRDDAAALLCDVLANGPKPATDVMRAAGALGISERTLDRAKGKLGIKSWKSDVMNGQWYWQLPTGPAPAITERSVSGDEKGANVIDMEVAPFEERHHIEESQ